MATVSVVLAMTSGMTFGRTCRVICFQSLLPSTLARSMYGRASTLRVWARTRRAVPGHEVTPRTTTVIQIDGLTEHRLQHDDQRDERAARGTSR